MTTSKKKSSKITPDAFELNINEPIDANTLGQYIKQKRVEAKMTQEITALLCGISKKTLIKIEKGGDVYFSTLMQVMNGLGIKLSFFNPISSNTTKGDQQDVWF